MTQTSVTIAYHKRLLWGWKKGSLIKSVYSSCRGLELGSQHPHPAAHCCPPLASVPYIQHAQTHTRQTLQKTWIQFLNAQSYTGQLFHLQRARSGKAGGRTEERADVWAWNDCSTPGCTAAVTTHTWFPENWSCQYHHRTEWGHGHSVRSCPCFCKQL